MNGNYYQNPTFLNSTPINIEEDTNISLLKDNTNIDNILKLNKGKRVNIYTSNNSFPGILEDNINDYILLSNPETGKWYLIKNIYINYIEFIEKINY